MDLEKIFYAALKRVRYGTNSVRNALWTFFQVSNCRTIITQRVEQRALKTVNDKALKDRALKDRALKDRASKDRRFKDRAFKDIVK